MPGLNGEVHVILINPENLPLRPCGHMVGLRPVPGIRTEANLALRSCILSV
jgi:hypothetical protein